MRGRESLDVSRKSPTATQTPSNPHEVSSSGTSADAPEPAFPGTRAGDAVQVAPDRWSRRPAVPPAVVVYSPEISHTAPAHERFWPTLSTNGLTNNPSLLPVAASVGTGATDGVQVPPASVNNSRPVPPAFVV